MQDQLHSGPGHRLVQGRQRDHQGSQGQVLPRPQRLRLLDHQQCFSRHGRRVRDQGHQRHGHGRLQVHRQSQQLVFLPEEVFNSDIY